MLGYMYLFELRVFIFSRYIPRKGLVDHMVSFSVLRNLHAALCDFPGGSVGKESACNVGDMGSIPGFGRMEKEKATHFSILAWRIPWTEEPHGLQSMGSQRVRHN